MKNREFSLIKLEEVDSTNNYAKGLLADGCREDTVIWAEKQISGRGRFDRDFISSSDAGLWFTLVFFPDILPKYLGLLSCAAALAVSVSLEKMAKVSARVKWPNDVEIAGKKVCGILPESAFENGKIVWMIIGIGVNITPPPGGFDEVLQDKATSVEQHSAEVFTKKELLNSIISEFFRLYETLESGDPVRIVKGLKEYSSVLGESVYLYVPNEPKPFMGGTVEGFGECGELILSDAGETKSINYGEVSLRRK